MSQNENLISSIIQKDLQRLCLIDSDIQYFDIDFLSGDYNVYEPIWIDCTNSIIYITELSRNLNNTSLGSELTKVYSATKTLIATYGINTSIEKFVSDICIFNPFVFETLKYVKVNLVR